MGPVAAIGDDDAEMPVAMGTAGPVGGATDKDEASATSLSPDDSSVARMLLLTKDLRKRSPAVASAAGAAAGAERARYMAADDDVAKPLVEDGVEEPLQSCSRREARRR